VTILTATGETHVARASKAQVARAVLGAVVTLRARPLAPGAAPAEPAA